MIHRSIQPTNVCRKQKHVKSFQYPPRLAQEVEHNLSELTLFRNCVTGLFLLIDFMDMHGKVFCPREVGTVWLVFSRGIYFHVFHKSRATRENKTTKILLPTCKANEPRFNPWPTSIQQPTKACQRVCL